MLKRENILMKEVLESTFAKLGAVGLLEYKTEPPDESPKCVKTSPKWSWETRRSTMILLIACRQSKKKWLILLVNRFWLARKFMLMPHQPKEILFYNFLASILVLLPPLRIKIETSGGKRQLARRFL